MTLDLKNTGEDHFVMQEKSFGRFGGLMQKEKANLYYFALIHMVALSLAMMGCATQNKSVGLGGAIGAGSGAVLGGIADPGKNGEYRTRNVIVGSALGGMAGMIAGSVIHEQTEKQKKEAFLKGKASAPPQDAGVMPTLRPARVESRWIEAHARGNVWVEGHFEHRIVEPSRWEKD
ncbi:MAG: hypothetical protein KF767_17685 [Bdellovibrionaceae bacterium]|nr:hypothetical protein [Pseudobdellovibrionaceae bacterium]